MASTGTALWPGASTFPGAAVYPGQGNLPLLDCYISFSDLSISPPVWTWVSPNDIRSFTISRSEGEAGTATLVLDNRDRAFDPSFVSSPYYPNVRPLNKVWLRAQFTGETNDMFVGYVESYEQQWPGGGWSDAIAVVKCSDEFKLLALSTLPVTNPPRNNYADVVNFDSPQVYYPLEAVQDLTAAPEIPGLSHHDFTEDDFELGQLPGKTPSRRHHFKKPLGRKAPAKKKRRFLRGHKPGKNAGGPDTGPG